MYNIGQVFYGSGTVPEGLQRETEDFNIIFFLLFMTDLVEYYPQQKNSYCTFISTQI